MVHIRRLHVLPFTRALGGRWDADSALDRFLGVSRGICEVLSRELPAAQLPGRRSWLEFYVRAAGQGPAVAEVARSHDASSGDGNLYIPEAFAELDAPQAAAAAFDVLDAALRELGRAYGWHPDSLDDLRLRVQASGLRFCWDSPWKAAPGRRHEARCVQHLADDGLGRMQLEVRERGGIDPIARTRTATAGTTAKTLRRGAATLRWHDALRVTVVPWVDLAGQQMGKLEVDLDRPEVVALERNVPVTNGEPYPVLTRRVHGGALVHMDKFAREQAAVWLQAGGDGFGFGIRGGRIPAAFRQAVKRVRDEVDGTRWLADTPFVNIQVQLALGHVDELLAGGTLVFHSAAGEELLTCLGLDVRALHQLDDEALVNDLVERLRRHVQLAAERRRLPPVPRATP